MPSFTCGIEKKNRKRKMSKSQKQGVKRVCQVQGGGEIWRGWYKDTKLAIRIRSKELMENM